MFHMDYEDNKTLFSLTLPVLVTHLNYGNHLGYDALLTLIQDARIFWLKEHQMSEASITGTVGFVVAAVMADYKSEAFHGDQLQIDFYISNVSNSSFILDYKVINTQTQKLVALAKTKQVFFDYAKRRVARTPQNFLEIVS